MWRVREAGVGRQLGIWSATVHIPIAPFLAVPAWDEYQLLVKCYKVMLGFRVQVQGWWG